MFKLRLKKFDSLKAYGPSPFKTPAWVSDENAIKGVASSPIKMQSFSAAAQQNAPDLAKPDPRAAAARERRADELVRLRNSGSALPGPPDQAGPKNSLMATSSLFQHSFRDQFDPDQKVVVFNVSHQQQRPKSTKPALRLMGLFADKASAVAYIRKAAPLLPGCNFWLAERGKWFLGCKTQTRQTDSRYSLAKINLLKRQHEQDKQRRNREFETNRTNKQQGEQGTSMERIRQRLRHGPQGPKRVSSRASALARKRKLQATQQGVFDAGPVPVDQQEQKHREAEEVPNQLVRRRQEFVVISFMRDTTRAVRQKQDDPEPAMIVWRAFGNRDEATAWTQHASSFIADYNLYVVDGYEWLFVEDVDFEAVEEKFRNAEQDNVMQQKKAEARKVAKMEDWCRQNDRPVPETVVEVDGAAQSDVLLPDQARDAPTFGRQTGAAEVKISGRDQQIDVNSAASKDVAWQELPLSDRGLPVLADQAGDTQIFNAEDRVALPSVPQ